MWQVWGAKLPNHTARCRIEIYNIQPTAGLCWYLRLSMFDYCYTFPASVQQTHLSLLLWLYTRCYRQKTTQQEILRTKSCKTSPDSIMCMSESYFYSKHYFTRAPKTHQRSPSFYSLLRRIFPRPVTTSQVYSNMYFSSDCWKGLSFETMGAQSSLCRALTGGFSGHGETSEPRLYTRLTLASQKLTHTRAVCRHHHPQHLLSGDLTDTEKPLVTLLQQDGV